jgi:hypothetical protein
MWILLLDVKRGCQFSNKTKCYRVWIWNHALTPQYATSPQAQNKSFLLLSLLFQVFVIVMESWLTHQGFLLLFLSLELLFGVNLSLHVEWSIIYSWASLVWRVLLPMLKPHSCPTQMKRHICFIHTWRIYMLKVLYRKYNLKSLTIQMRLVYK